MDYNLDELRNTCIKHGIKMVLLYGSQAMGNSDEKSDVDLGLLLKDDSYDFEDIIKDLMKVFNGDIIDVAILNHGDPVLKFEIISNYKILFCEEDEIFLEFYLNTVKQYNDTKKFRILEKVYLENFIRGERDGIHKCNPPKVNKSF
ncbi:nucleotidyltransferase domain-containing protein [Clostridium estertheticum]|uniref:type VII toxin-antitoxin system MntA family adenylyltransferase antitoxin n=1 Tax=Clostridium estertheticum TaxID=238834 RepID=UPI001CF3E111|nr:nucleotidyltransferase domain-containing protein [Clostridium estertheticum]MCB2307525.1 nucleotidyltransferase domain-containing protein [Clostridium estertheticum]MCB2345782.1 nucleotidyltransferase domain-containing protein [Clostridium estertheticum]MCB2351014.1 nucleotidyltransferase domain-containing protein [Clostridium estertheticum]WAG47815.1 nucleotidyltransferase domain-containing protein [Clostridium estertheticum]